MKIKISRILIAIDGSHSSMEAARQAVLLSKTNNTQLFALNIINTQPWFYSSTLYGWAPSETMEKIHESDIQKAQTWLDQIKENAISNGVKIITQVSLVPYTQSSTAGAIVDYAGQNQIDLIVISTRDHSGLKMMLLGSVASAVLTHSHCPVLIVR